MQKLCQITYFMCKNLGSKTYNFLKYLPNQINSTVLYKACESKLTTETGQFKSNLRSI